MAHSQPGILIVEDDESIRESLQELLELEGYSVSLAENGLVALNQIARRNTYELIILDLSMPVMDGKTFLQNITEKHSDMNKTPILIMSAAGRVENLSYPSLSFLRKPFDVDELLSRVKTLTKQP